MFLCNKERQEEIKIEREKIKEPQIIKKNKKQKYPFPENSRFG